MSSQTKRATAANTAGELSSAVNIAHAQWVANDNPKIIKLEGKKYSNDNPRLA